MSKSLRSCHPTMREQIAHRRETTGTMGLGYWGARDALAKLADPVLKKTEKAPA